MRPSIEDLCRLFLPGRRRVGGTFRFPRVGAARRRRAALEAAARQTADECEAARRRLLESAQHGWAVAPTQAFPQIGRLMTMGAEQRSPDLDDSRPTTCQRGR